MQFPLPQLTTILLLIHLGLGCCFHHAHAYEVGSCELEAAQMTGCGNHFHSPLAVAARNGANEASLGIEHEGTHAHECCGGDCTFIADRPRLGANSEQSRQFSSLIGQTFVNAGSRDALLAGGTVPELPWSSLRRSHLMLQVWQL